MPTDITVPDDIADEVRRFVEFVIADRLNRQACAPTQTATITDSIPDYPLWSDSDVIELANMDTATAGYYRAIMDGIISAGAEGSWVSLDDLAEWTKIRRSALSTFRTHLYRYVNSHLPQGSSAPFTGVWGTDMRPSRGREVFYRVSMECALQWRRIQPHLNKVS